MRDQHRVLPPRIVRESRKLAENQRNRDEQQAAADTEYRPEKTVHSRQDRQAHEFRQSPAQQPADGQDDGKQEDAAEPHLQLSGVEPARHGEAHRRPEIQRRPYRQQQRRDRDRLLDEASHHADDHRDDDGNEDDYVDDRHRRWRKSSAQLGQGREEILTERLHNASRIRDAAPPGPCGRPSRAVPPLLPRSRGPSAVRS